MRYLKERRRRRLRERPFPEEWETILQRTFPRYARLGADDRTELRGDIQVFLAEKRFEGAGGLEITDEIRVTVAAQACLLLLHRQTDVYPGLYSIIVYPHEYVAAGQGRTEAGLVDDELQVRLGETAARGALALSWDAALRGAGDIHDCRNVVFHEFAHQLDAQDGAFDGAPLLPERSMYLAWARVLGEEYATLRDHVARHRPTDLDPYGATNPAEFFAVATECFFQRPGRLRAAHPALYDELRLFYRQDPADDASPASLDGAWRPE
jgi:Mlc titration factor MtfA (ptsG expression regulator)